MIMKVYNGKFVITDLYYTYSIETSPEVWPVLISKVIELGMDVPEYLGPESHGGSTVKMPSPSKAHVRWFIWLNQQNHVVFIGDRANYETQPFSESHEIYMLSWRETRNIAIDLGGTSCKEKTLDQYGSIEEIESAFKLAPNYTNSAL
jgi:hypothetical protein